MPMTLFARATAQISLCLFLAACTTSEPTPTPAAPTSPPSPAPATSTPLADQQRYPDIIAVEITPEADGTYSFAVTVSSPYDTPERYADAWRILAPDGSVLAVRELLHDHANEQPFTRSLSGVRIPEGVTRVTIEGRDRQYGYGGATITVDVPGRTGTAPDAAPGDGAAPPVGLTYHSPDGNRLVNGSTTLATTPVDVDLEGRPEWLVALPTTTGAFWAVVLEDGRVQAFTTEQGDVRSIAIEPGRVAPGTPPLLYPSDRTPGLMAIPDDASPQSHPVPLSAGRIAYINTDGDLVLQHGDSLERLAVDALPDARILVDERERLLLLAGPSDRYAHAVLGDSLEATRIVLVRTLPRLQVERSIAIEQPRVVEGIAPIWADFNGDNVREIVVTLSDARQGAQIVAYNEQGHMMAAGPPIGSGGRWRHQIAIGPFAPDGASELVAVRTPHLGGVIEFYSWRGNELALIEELPGYTSHVLGSRNLDMAVAADVDGDGRPELVLPTQDRTSLVAIGRHSAGAEMRWSAPVGAPVSSNLVALALPNGVLALGAGRADGVLRLWLPR